MGRNSVLREGNYQIHTANFHFLNSHCCLNFLRAVLLQVQSIRSSAEYMGAAGQEFRLDYHNNFIMTEVINLCHYS